MRFHLSRGIRLVPYREALVCSSIMVTIMILSPTFVCRLCLRSSKDSGKQHRGDIWGISLLQLRRYHLEEPEHTVSRISVRLKMQDRAGCTAGVKQAAVFQVYLLCDQSVEVSVEPSGSQLH